MDPHQDRTSDDSDSAPEDVAFQDAKNDALAHLRTVSDAVKEKKKMRKEQIKQRQERLTEQRKVKKQKLEELESKKLPDFVLDNLKDNEDGQEAEVKEEVKNLVSNSQNSRIVFDEEALTDGEQEENSDDFLALETNRTDFKVVTSTDLKSSKFSSKDAFSFRERMLFGDRVKREPHKNQRIRQEKLKVAGLFQKVTSKS